jgi:hypothetical protein
MKKFGLLIFFFWNIIITPALKCHETYSWEKILNQKLKMFNLSQFLYMPETTNPLVYKLYRTEIQSQLGSKNFRHSHPKINKKKGSRAFWESFAFMSVSAALYWWRWGLWAEDWQYSFTWEDQKKRFFSLEATKFDSNSFMTNFSHGPNGAIFYNIARTNRLPVSTSYLYALFTSLFWEYVVEYKEIVSLNDNIFNLFCGYSMGEPLFQIGRYLSNQPSKAAKIIGYMFNPALAVNNWLDRKKGDKLDRDRDTFMQYANIFFGPVYGDYSDEKNYFNHFNLGIETRLVSIPGYDKPGKVSRKINKTLFSEIYMDIYLGTKYIEEFNIYSKAAFWGFFKKNITENEGQSLNGYQFVVALGSAYDMYRKRSTAPYDTITSGSSHSERIEVTTPTEFSDKMAIINIVGPIIELSLFWDKWRIILGAECFFDFAMINSLALKQYSEFNSLSGIKSTLRYYGYYYAYGFTGLSSLSIQYEKFNLKMKVKYHQYYSIQGLDRFQDYLRDDFSLNDSRLVFSFSMAYQFPRTPLQIVLGYQTIGRKGTIKDIIYKNQEPRIFIQLKYNF